MRTEQMHYLIEISKNKSLTSASQKLFVTPQALSLSIKTLEEELGFLILERNALGVSWTAEGKALLELANVFLEGLGNIQAKIVNNAQGLSGKMLLIAPHGVSVSYLPKLLDHSYHNHPKLKVESLEYDYLDLIGAVLDKEAYFALTYKVYINDVDIIQDIPESLHFTPFLQRYCVCLAHDHFPIAHYKTVSLKSILKYPYIMYEPARYIFEKILAYAGTPERVITARNILVADQLTNSGVGILISLIGKGQKQSLIPIGKNAQVIELKEKIRLVFGCITRKDEQMPQPIKDQLAYLESYFEKM